MTDLKTIARRISIAETLTSSTARVARAEALRAELLRAQAVLSALPRSVPGPMRQQSAVKRREIDSLLARIQKLLPPPAAPNDPGPTNGDQVGPAVQAGMNASPIMIGAGLLSLVGLIYLANRSGKRSKKQKAN